MVYFVFKPVLYLRNMYGRTIIRNNNNMVYSIFYLFQCTKSLQIEHHIWQDTSTSIKSDTNTLFRKNI